MTEISPNQTLRSFCFADRPFALKANLRLRVSHHSKSIDITAGQTASHDDHCSDIAFAIPGKVFDLIRDRSALGLPQASAYQVGIERPLS